MNQSTDELEGRNQIDECYGEVQVLTCTVRWLPKKKKEKRRGEVESCDGKEDRR